MSLDAHSTCARKEGDNAPISRQDTVIEIVRKGDGAQPHDEVYVTTSLTLAADLDVQEVTLLLPMSSAANHKPLMRYTGCW